MTVSQTDLSWEDLKAPGGQKIKTTNESKRDYCILRQSFSLHSCAWLACSATAVLSHSGHTTHSQTLYLRWPNPRCVEQEEYNLPAVFVMVDLPVVSVHTNGNLTFVQEDTM